jgi:hypothetical protein
VYGLAVLTLLGGAAALRPVVAQDAPPPTLDQILERLETNLLHYDTVVPSFFCDEHVDSRLRSMKGTTGTIVDSVFRLKRVTGSDGKILLTESREMKMLDGRPAKADDIVGPGILRGAFSGGLALVSLSQKACMHYTLKPIPEDGQGPYVVEFESVPKKQRSAGCLLQEDGSGRVLIDSDSMQIERIQLTAPHHVIGSVNLNDGRLEGVWTVSVDYVPVVLGDETLWMPSTISGRITGENVPSVWSFDATYRNFHKLEVTSRIVPSGAP